MGDVVADDDILRIWRLPLWLAKDDVDCCIVLKAKAEVDVKILDDDAAVKRVNAEDKRIVVTVLL